MREGQAHLHCAGVMRAVLAVTIRLVEQTLRDKDNARACADEGGDGRAHCEGLGALERSRLVEVEGRPDAVADQVRSDTLDVALLET